MKLKSSNLLLSTSIFCYLIIPANVLSQELIKDINPGTSYSNPTKFWSENDIVYFEAYNTVYGAELYKTDGTVEGTVLLKDINPGSGGSSPFYFAHLNSKTCFLAFNTEYGHELWQTDGTTEGTILVKDINPGSTGSHPSYITEFNNALYFSASQPGTGAELWRTDGTAEGTILVKDVLPGNMGSSPENFTVINDVLFFTAYTSAGTELWKTDGTREGTVLVKDIFPGLGDAFPGETTLLNVNGTLFFVATDGVNGQELWKSDGTAQGTAMVKNISGDSRNSSPENLVQLGNNLFFAANDYVHGAELWKTDGTSEGTVMVKDLYEGSLGGMADYAAFTISLNDKIFFYAQDGIHGYELWTTDGTENGTSMVKDIFAGSQSSNYVVASTLTNASGVLYFFAKNQEFGFELWKSDGSVEGTEMVADIMIGPSNSAPGEIYVFGSGLLISAADEVYGRELFKIEQIITNLESSEVADFNIYPNPSKGIFFIEPATVGLNANYEVYNTLGELVKKGAEQSVDLSGFAKGMYFIRVYQEGKNNTKKVVLE